MKKRNFWVLATVMAFTTGMMGACTSAGNSSGNNPVDAQEEGIRDQEQQEVTLQYSTTSTPGTVYVQAFQRMADEVEEKTEGKVKIVIYDSSQLGNESDVDTNVLDGSIDMCNTGSGELGKRYAAFNVFQAPYLFESYEHFENFIGSDIEKELFGKKRTVLLSVRLKGEE